MCRMKGSNRGHTSKTKELLNVTQFGFALEAVTLPNLCHYTVREVMTGQSTQFISLSSCSFILFTFVFM